MNSCVWTRLKLQVTAIPFEAGKLRFLASLLVLPDHCEYKGQVYGQGETWEDGCDYNCVCEDASTGSWRCVDK